MKDEQTNFKKLTTKEACELINLLKQICQKKNLELPHSGERIEFNVSAIDNKKKFIININHNNANPEKYTFQGRTLESNVQLLRLDVNPNGEHRNPDGSKICGTHLHIYSEENDMEEAIEFNIDNPNLYDYCIAFFKKFNIIYDDEVILYQEEF